MNPKALNTEFTRFVFVGVLNTLSYYSIYLLLHNVFNLPYLLAHLVGFLISLNISFFLNCYVTYRIKPTLKKYLYFPLTQVVNMSVSTVLIFIFVEFLHLNSNIAPFAAVLFTVPITFVVSSKILKDTPSPK
ncbi:MULTISPECIES: GtrA family protein [Planococcus]|uniref:Polysaccharide biosynthesis protein n=2 Tax=Planococcus TaxID=1372 RepID=A0ABM5WTI9_9BACL|nr:MULTISPECIES: GtrA family protein [Planococcus]ALS77595.1 polysaccharide biosynthesis protein [Planococcus kocurii]AQU80521.1 polysaccharide biosynthesis protein [Planococcus faecalis]KAA0959021.1 GtrA family protein [Planococcus sp. ANT_H30]MDJ0330188.1 GtrA family protein [Planococcus sp. S3-L1]OHX52113.1 polysaccharide biosynthesis protein [Planococcus faecalis]